jgi:hypothetical protein
MAQVIFILGAGASKEGGAPTMPEFLDEADRLWKSGYFGQKSPDHELVFKGIAALQQVHSKAQLNIHNIETVFSAFEMAKLLDIELGVTYGPSIGSSTLNLDASALLNALVSLITTTLEAQLRFPVINDHGVRISAPRPYDAFSILVRKIRNDFTPNRSVALITFNYDVGLDFAIPSRDYCLDGAANPKKTPLLKLHGSLNWTRCAECGKVLTHELKYETSAAVGSTITLPVRSELSKLSHCHKPAIGDPVIVPPTWNKSDDQSALSSVWSQAAQEIQQAEYIFVIGYSLPNTDSFFRYLYALGSSRGVPLKAFAVFNPDRSVEDRFKSLLGPGAEARYTFHEVKFKEAIKIVEDLLS